MCLLPGATMWRQEGVGRGEPAVGPLEGGHRPYVGPRASLEGWGCPKARGPVTSMFGVRAWVSLLRARPMRIISFTSHATPWRWDSLPVAQMRKWLREVESWVCGHTAQRWIFIPSPDPQLSHQSRCCLNIHCPSPGSLGNPAPKMGAGGEWHKADSGRLWGETLGSSICQLRAHDPEGDEPICKALKCQRSGVREAVGLGGHSRGC